MKKRPQMPNLTQLQKHKPLIVKAPVDKGVKEHRAIRAPQTMICCLILINLDKD